MPGVIAAASSAGGRVVVGEGGDLPRGRSAGGGDGETRGGGGVRKI